MDFTHKSDKDLLRLIILHDDHRAFREFFSRYYGRLVRFCFYYVKTHENAEDVVEEVFYKILSKRKHLDVRNVSSFMFVMAKNESLTFIKKNRLRLMNTNLEAEEDYHFLEDHTPDAVMISDEFEKLICAVIDSFPPKRKTIFQLSREENLSYAQIANLLQISPKTVESHICVALKAIRTAIADFDDGINTTMRRFDVT